MLVVPPGNQDRRWYLLLYQKFSYTSCYFTLSPSRRIILFKMPILDDKSLEFISHSSSQTRRVGMRLGALLDTGDVVHLVGELGAGKTTMVQGISSGWGSTDQVTSPSYVLVNIYRRPGSERFAHLDAYRLSGAAEAEVLDLDDLIDGGPLVVEWAPRIQGALPGDCLTVILEWVEEEQRRMRFRANGTRYEELLETFQSSMFGGD